MVASVHINPDGIADTPSENDQFGFKPYVDSLATFLASANTQPPLAVSVEGSWGSGKSSFLRQLAKAIEKIVIQKKQAVRIIHFNAWRSEKDEALWATFALTVIRNLESRASWCSIVCSNVALSWKRFDWGAGKWQLIKAASSLALLFVVALWLYFNRGTGAYQFVLNNPGEKAFIFLSLGGAAILAWQKLKPIVRNSLKIDLATLVRDPKYEDKTSLFDRFHNDFSFIMKSYVGSDTRVFVFIDDLDRCEVPRAADLMQAINLLLSSEQTNLFFILAFDRDMVAAGLAAKHEKIFPFLPPNSEAVTDLNPRTVGRRYAYAYLEKFIQVPFQVPEIQGSLVSVWASKIAGDPGRASMQSQGFDQTTSTPSEPELQLAVGGDPQGFEAIVTELAPLFAFNPRRLKQFVNVFRLRIQFAIRTGVFIPASETSSGIPTIAGITLAQLGAFTAITLRWPGLIGDLVRDKSLLSKVDKVGNAGVALHHSMTDKERDDLRLFFSLSKSYSLKDVDIVPLLSVMPETSFREIRDVEQKDARSILVSGLRKTPNNEQSGASGGEMLSENVKSDVSFYSTTTPISFYPSAPAAGPPSPATERGPSPPPTSRGPSGPTSNN